MQGTGLALSHAQAAEPAVASAADAAEQLVRHRLKVLAARVQQMRVLHSAADALSPPKSYCRSDGVGDRRGGAGLT